MYQVDEKDKIVKLQNVPQPSAGAPLPIVLSDENKLLLAYLLQNTPENWDGSQVKIVDFATDDELVVIVEFEHYWSAMFGAPNDEAFHGHPLYERGLQPYGVYEIENSSWRRNFERMNSVHSRHNPERFEKFKHFIFAFHDSTFECIAENFEISLHEGSLENALIEMQKRLFARWSY